MFPLWNFRQGQVQRLLPPPLHTQRWFGPQRQASAAASLYLCTNAPLPLTLPGLCVLIVFCYVRSYSQELVITLQRIWLMCLGKAWWWEKQWKTGLPLQGSASLRRVNRISQYIGASNLLSYNKKAPKLLVIRTAFAEAQSLEVWPLTVMDTVYS